MTTDLSRCIPGFGIVDFDMFGPCPWRVMLITGDHMRQTDTGKRTQAQVAAANGLNPVEVFRTPEAAARAMHKAYRRWKGANK